MSCRLFVIDFKVMIRPLKALNLIHSHMEKMLEKLSEG